MRACLAPACVAMAPRGNALQGARNRGRILDVGRIIDIDVRPRDMKGISHTLECVHAPCSLLLWRTCRDAAALMLHVCEMPE